jgi:DNA gyrase/topoisomerase IV subunit A
MLNIKDLIEKYVAFRKSVVHRRSVYQLDKAKARLHILE